VRALYAARARGDFLLVGLHDDATVNALRGQNQPISSLHERALCVLALGCVDEVILGAPLEISADLIKTMNIRCVVGGCDDAPDTPSAPPHVLALAAHAGGAAAPRRLKRYAVPREHGIYHASEEQPSLTMGDIVTRIIENRKRYEARNAKRERRELQYMMHQKAYVEEL